jgi:AraC-like DNA-binding protein
MRFRKINSADLTLDRGPLGGRADAAARRYSPATGAHLSRRVGVTPGEFVERMQVEHARRLLEPSDLTSERIAAESRLGSVETVNRMFRTMLGTTPGIPAAFRSLTPLAPHRRRIATSFTRRNEKALACTTSSASIGCPRWGKRQRRNNFRGMWCRGGDEPPS